MVDETSDSVQLALLAHDLRTPLSAMRTTAELIGKDALTDRQTGYLDILIRSIDALTDMTSELVFAAHPSETPRSSERDAFALIKDTVEVFRLAAEHKGLAYETELDGESAVISGRCAGPVRRALSTLIDNAIKYTDEGHVSVVSHLKNTEVAGARTAELMITVSDSGSGIDTKERARLFNPFVRGATGKAHGDGAGLGLWGATQMVKDMGGSLRLVSPKAGGSRFELNIPVDQEKTNIEPVARSTTPFGAELEAHVLVVDDNETNRRLLSALLESFGITCDQADGGPAAIEWAQKKTFDAILLDLHMPGMSGLEAAGNLREHALEKDTPLIAVTAALESVGDKRLRQAGFVEILTKPLSPKILFEATEHARRFRKLRAEKFGSS